MKIPTTVSMGILLFTSVVLSQTQGPSSILLDSLAKKDSIGTPSVPIKISDSAALYPIFIKTDPDSAVVLIDDSVRGLSPLKVIDLKSGEHNITIKKKGFYQKKVSFVVDSSSSKELSIILQRPGSLTITSEPLGSDVFWSGEKKGVTPLNITLLKPGNYAFQLKKDLFIPFEKSITIVSGISDTVFCKMSPDTAFTNSISRQQKQLHSKKTKITSIVLAVTFGLFAAIVAIVDFSGDK